VQDSLYTAGRRGVGATVLLEKIAGAAAERGDDVESVAAVARHVNERARSFGIALSSCTPPAAGKPIFELPEGEIELGIGIHGEPGRRRENIRTAREIVEVTLEAILSDLKPSEGARVLPFVFDAVSFLGSMTMISLTRPKAMMPVHGEFRMLAAHARLAEEGGVDPAAIVIAENGTVVELSPDGVRVAGEIEAGVTFVDGLGVGDVQDVALRDRRHLSEDGVVIVVTTLSGQNGGGISFFGPPAGYPKTATARRVKVGARPQSGTTAFGMVATNGAVVNADNIAVNLAGGPHDVGEELVRSQVVGPDLHGAARVLLGLLETVLESQRSCQADMPARVVGGEREAAAERFGRAMCTRNHRTGTTPSAASAETTPQATWRVVWSASTPNALGEIAEAKKIPVRPIPIALAARSAPPTSASAAENRPFQPAPLNPSSAVASISTATAPCPSSASVPAALAARTAMIANGTSRSPWKTRSLM